MPDASVLCVLQAALHTDKTGKKVTRFAPAERYVYSTLHQYITGIITNRKQKLIQINSMPDHIHIFVGITPDIAISDLVRDIKVSATKFIKHTAPLERKSGFEPFL